MDLGGYPLSIDVRRRLPSVTRGKIVDLVVPQCHLRFDSGLLWLPAVTRGTITDSGVSPLSLEVRQ